MMIGLMLVFLIVLILPFTIHKIERQLEFFLFVMGGVAATVAGQWSLHLIEEALVEPLMISVAVFIFGVLFKYSQSAIDKHVNRIKNRMGLHVFIFCLVFLLGLISSFVTAILSSLVLVEIISYLKLSRKSEIKIVVMTCFSIGLGAVLTPIGEPLSTIVVSKLKGEPYHAGFFFLLRQLGVFVIPALLLIAGAASMIVKKDRGWSEGLKEKVHENIKGITVRAVKVYVFIFGLILLGTAFKPVIDQYISKISFTILYWFNIISAVLDNATLAAAEIGPAMSLLQIKAAILALAVAGGMLIPGNIPNIISAGKLGIGSKEWMRIGLPVGIILMAFYFLILLIVR
jgi:predicted cation transporter